MCKDWKENIEKIYIPIMAEAFRKDTRGYDGVKWKYCPWCGEDVEDADL